MCGFVFTLSKDLIHWTPPRVFKENPLPHPHIAVLKCR
jgi:hypothetical protein